MGYYLLFMSGLLIFFLLFEKCVTSQVGITRYLIGNVCLLFTAMIFHESISSIVGTYYTIFEQVMMIVIPSTIVMMKIYIEKYIKYQRLYKESVQHIEKIKKTLLEKTNIIHQLLQNEDALNCPFCKEKEIRILDKDFEKVYICNQCGRSFKVEDLVKIETN